MKSWIAISLAGLAISSLCLVSVLAKVKVEVFYEALSPYCAHFLLQQMKPAYKVIKDHMDVHVYPFGLAEITNSGEILCEHGPLECRANKIHACVHMLTNYDFDAILPFVSCLQSKLFSDNPSLEQAYLIALSELDNFTQSCAKECGLDWNKINECENGQKGIDLLKEAGKKTGELKPKIEWVPTILLNGEFNAFDQYLAQYVNFTELVLSKEPGYVHYTMFKAEDLNKI